MLSTYRKLHALLSPAERSRARLLFLLMLATALVEVFGVASIMPFVALLSNPDVVTTNKWLALAYTSFGFNDTSTFLSFLGVMVFVIFVGSLALKALSTYAILRFSNMRSYAFSMRLLEGYLNRPYEFFLRRNTAELSKTLFSEVGEVINGILIPALRLVSGTIVAILLVTLLLLVDPLFTVITAIVIGGSFAAIYTLTRKYLQRTGKDRVQTNKHRFIAANEALNGIKELRLMGREQNYLDRFSAAAERFAHLQSTSKAIGDLPVFAVQAISLGGILSLLVYASSFEGSSQELLPVLALFAFASYRLLPALQVIFKNSTQLRFYGAALESLHRDFQTDQEPEKNSTKAHGSADARRVNGDIVLDSVTYAYSGASKPSIDDVSLTIKKGTCIGFVGSTGAGKSTLLDLILGLLEPLSGRIIVDGQHLCGDSLKGWQRNIGYVPQSIFLCDASVAQNIAFGVPPEKIDYAAVERAAQAAHIHSFVTRDLPDGYQTEVGERGIRLSGGQRQRLGIARALYHDPEVIVFDEATSALDNATEAAVMEAVAELSGRKTILMIAHRLSTVERCDCIFLLQGGRLLAQGNYRTLLASSADFAKIANKTAESKVDNDLLPNTDFVEGMEHMEAIYNAK